MVTARKETDELVRSLADANAKALYDLMKPQFYGVGK